MFGAPKLGRFWSLASLILVVNVVGKLQRKRTLAASRGFLAAARLCCYCLRLRVSMTHSVLTFVNLVVSYLHIAYFRHVMRSTYGKITYAHRAYVIRKNNYRTYGYTLSGRNTYGLLPVSCRILHYVLPPKKKTHTHVKFHHDCNSVADMNRLPIFFY